MIFDMKMFGVNRNIIVVRSEGYESVLRHSHNFIEIVYVRSGRAIHSVSGRNIEIKKGDFFVISDPGVEHSMKPVCDEKDFRIINIVCSRDLFAGAEFPGPTELFNSEDMEYGRKTDVIIREYESDASSEAIMRLYLVNLLNDFQIEKLSRKRSQTDRHRTRRNVDDYIRSATRYIQENYMEKITLKDIAGAVGLYPAYLQKIFRENRSTGVIEFLIRYRMEKSSQYLLETSLTVDEISGMVGIGDLKNFYTTFKKYFNMTPIQYRNTHRTGEGDGSGA